MERGSNLVGPMSVSDWPTMNYRFNTFELDDPVRQLCPCGNMPFVDWICASKWVVACGFCNNMGELGESRLQAIELWNAEIILTR